MILKRRPDIERFLSRPPKDIRAAVIYGRDRGVVRERAETLAKAVSDRPDDPFDVALLTDGDLDADAPRLEGELSALSMMGGRRLVRLRMFSDKATPDRIASEGLSAHIAGKLNPDCFFLIEAGNLDGKSATRRIGERADACAVIPCYEDEAGDIARMTREALARDQLSLETAALDLFVSRLPHERGVARQEIERLALFLGPGRTSPGVVGELTEFLGVEPEASLGEAAQEAFGGRAGTAQAHLRRAAAEGEGGVAAIRALVMHAGRLRKMLVLSRAGKSLQEAAKSAGVFWKNEREMLRQARAWTLTALDDLSPELMAAETAGKTTGSPDALIAERLAMTVAGRARRLGL
jgi:DNA polymerase-3 subunit delta